ncbi:MAG TPA: serine/threonine-protein kinase, partial [Gemmatimonadaceae bacterium]
MVAKFVRSALAAPDLARRFVAERQILADLNHPGIARLLDGGTTIDGTPYIVLEYVDGAPVDEFCDATGLGVPERVALLIKVCDAVHAAHRANVIHRDLKPSNILVTEDGAPKLMDFGIAKLVSDLVAPSTLSALQVLTPAYASPEQVRGQPVTFASDVYSLGVVMYQLLTGHLPFDLSRASAGEVERRVCREVPPLLSRAARDRDAAWKRLLTGDLEAIVAKALEKRADQRYGSVQALASDLRRWASAPPGHRWMRTLRHRMKRQRAVLAVTAIAATLGAATGVRALAVRRDAVIELRVLPPQVLDHELPAPFRVVSADVNGDGRRDLVWNHLDDSTNQVVVAH